MATIHIEDIPPGSHIGLNLHSWQSGPNFRGLRGISPGLNCLHITIAEVVTTKYAVWLDLTVGTVICYKWDKHAQTIVAIDNSYALSSEGQANPFLLECPTEDDREWTSITTYLTPELVRTMIPLEQVVCSTTSSNVDSDASNLSHLGTTIQDHDEAEFTFLPIDLKRSWPAGAVGREITLLALDKSWLLRDTIGRFGGIDALLAQFEFCFLGVLLYSSITSFEQWNIMFKLICSAKTAISEIPAFFSGFLELIQDQMQQISVELWNEIFSLTVPRNLTSLQVSLSELETQAIGKVIENLEVLQEYLSSEFGMEEDHAQQQAIYPADELSDDDLEDDERPVIVET